MAKGLKIAHKQASGTLTDQSDGAIYGGVGGVPQTITSTGVKTINVQYNTSANAVVANGYIITQKGKREFLVANSAANATGVYGTQVTLIQLVNKTGTNGANALVASEGRIQAYNTSNVAFNVSRINNQRVYDWSGNKYLYKTNTAASATWANVAVA
jgi:hypothetical protein